MNVDPYIKMFTADEIISLKEESYRRGFQDGFRQGVAHVVPTKPHWTDFLKPSASCYNPDCPSPSATCCKQSI